MRGRILLILKFLVLVFGLSILIFIREAMPIISGYGCKILCSGVFVAGRTPEAVIRDDLGSFPFNLGTYTVDRADSSVTGSVLGMATRVALYRSGLGATLVSGMTEETLKEQRIERVGLPAVEPDTIDWPMGDRVRAERVNRVPVGDTAGLGAAVGMAFGDGGARPTGTRAVVVVYHGRIVAERYAPGFDRRTRLTGWSMSKGITNALVGILVNEGKLNIYQPAPVEEWQEDQRSRITIEELLHMESGLRWWEFYAGPSDATRMLFKEKDMGAYAMRSSVRNPPGKVFNYSSGTANILSAIIRKTLADSDYYRFPYEQLFYKIGMYSALPEPDAGGTFAGSSYCYATARDWARFGLLYLQDGVWNGQRILPKGWVDFTQTGDSASGNSYGALWWLNKGLRHPKLPEDCYSCEGYEGQYIWVIPSKDLVVVRLACEHGRRLDPNVFVPAVMGALR
jgi:CubicO group peptidase (beta-lactamase class C family)